MKILKYLLIASVTVNLFASKDVKIKNDEQKSAWQGYYFGTLPCSTCKGIESWISLKSVNGEDKYEIREKFLGEKNRYNNGQIGWIDSHKTFALLSYPDKKMSISDKSINFLEYPSHKLEKVEAFNDENSVLLIYPNSILSGKIKGKKIIGFSGMINFDNPTLNGYKSIKSKYVFHCKAKKYELSRTSYYKGRYGMRDFVYPKDENTRGLFDIKSNPLLNKAFDKYCK